MVVPSTAPWPPDRSALPGGGKPPCDGRANHDPNNDQDGSDHGREKLVIRSGEEDLADDNRGHKPGDAANDPAKPKHGDVSVGSDSQPRKGTDPQYEPCRIALARRLGPNEE